MVTCESQRATAVAEKFFSQFKLLAPLFQIFWQFSSSNTLVRDITEVDKFAIYVALVKQMKLGSS